MLWPATSDRNFYDRNYFNAHDRSGEIFVITGLGYYPNLGTKDAYLLVALAALHAVDCAREPSGRYRTGGAAIALTLLLQAVVGIATLLWHVPLLLALAALSMSAFGISFSAFGFLPAVLALEKVGPDRFLKTLRTAGVEPGVAKDEVRTSLGIALGSASISPLELAGLYSGLANGGRFAPPSVRRDRPRAEPVRLIGPAAAWYVADILSDAPLPEGFAALPPALRERRIAYKTGTSAGFRDAWAAGYSANWTVVVWVGHPDGTSRAGQLGRLSALPIVFKAFDRLPGEDNRPAPPSADVLRVSSWRDLPPRMRTLGPTGPSDAGLRIAYPAPESRIELGAQETVPLSAHGGSGSLRWLVDGRPLDGNRWTPQGTGEARVAVVDEAGHSSAVTVRIVRRP